ncbi:phosphorylase family protein [Actinomadura algeriensis]|uniref:Nucleoside phosphorylase n=1 Tax=Actinomadura algeriensis TaxID=1679523 RepID=A0ABR9JRP6_9ACTN|nr:AAA family ATPase [Actinomadura algeriensis]MBE1533158.1 nucleoside phosphorylase [Actinomadura algeriensis]
MGRTPAGTERRLRALVLTALRVEYRAMRAHLTDLGEREHRTGTRFEVGRLRGAECEIALVQVGRGNVRAGVIAERIIESFRPDLVLCAGVAGALHDDLRLGDVVVATRVDAYQGGTAAEDFLARPQTWAAPYRLEELARSVDLYGGWQDGPGATGGDEPVADTGVHFRPIAAGDVVLDGRDSALFGQLRLHNNDAAAIDMEDAGIAHAAHLNDVPALVIRGISDRADGHKEEADRAGWQRRAAVAAAAFGAALLAHGHDSAAGSGGADPVPADPGEPPRPGTPQLAYLQEKTSGFVGRESAFAEFRSFLDEHPSGHLIVEGLPGVGKTSLLAAEVMRNGWPAHFNIAAQRINDPAAFLSGLHAQLADRHGVRLPPPGAGDDLDGRYLGRLLEETADRLPRDGRLVVVIDALDEVAHVQPGANALFIPTVLPAGLYMLVSRRSRTAPLQIDGASAVVDLMDRPDESRRDMERFVRNSLTRPELAARITGASERERAVSSLLDRSELNFMYLVYVLRDIEYGRMRPDDLSSLPAGLTRYYERHLEQMLASGGAALSLRTIYALAAIREPIPASLLAGVVRVSELRVVRLLADWAQFLHISSAAGASTYGFYHQGFCDFLLRNDTIRAAGVDMAEISSMVGHRLIASLGLDLDG